MTFENADNPQLMPFRDLLPQYCPRWLRNGNIGKVLYTIGLHLDVLDDMLNVGIQRRFPIDISEDADGLLAANRYIIRGENEPWSTYSVRLRRWLLDHRIRGGAYALLQQLNAFWAGAFPISLTHYGTNVRYFDMTTGGVITRGLHNNVSTKYGVGDWLLIYTWPDPLPPPVKWGDTGVKWGDGHIWGSGLSPSTVAALRRVPRQWGNAHTRGRIRLQYVGDLANKIEIALGDPADPTTPT